VHLDECDPCIRVVALQICWGCGYPSIDPNLDHAKRVIRDTINSGRTPAGWAWCDGPNASAADAEARYHAQTVLEIGLQLFVANCEEPYDAHGNASDPRFTMANTYAAAFRQVAPNVELGLTTTPRWASDGTGMRQAGATMMPQCFTGAISDGSAEIQAAVPFMESWGWDRSRQRPLVQTYATNGVYPDPAVYNLESDAYDVGVVPYTLEQAPGNIIKQLSGSISRPPFTPDPPDPEPPEPVAPPPDLPFARALYPPDAQAKGKTPSKDGKDVQAVKRACWRAGFWTGPSYSNTYTNEFSHGNATYGGVQGFQVAHVACQPTGYYGKTTHEALVAFVIPSGPNKGQYAFDAYAIDLYKQAPAA
jgi:hypothetical protein